MNQSSLLYGITFGSEREEENVVFGHILEDKQLFLLVTLPKADTRIRQCASDASCVDTLSSCVSQWRSHSWVCAFGWHTNKLLSRCSAVTISCLWARRRHCYENMSETLTKDNQPPNESPRARFIGWLSMVAACVYLLCDHWCLHCSRTRVPGLCLW